MKTETYDKKNSTAAEQRAGDKSGSSKMETDKQEMAKKMEAAGKPGPAHQALDALKGNWKAEVKCWMEPGGQPQVSRGTSKTNWILNGHFLEEEFRGESMGKQFTGRYLLGYDNVKQKFNSVWISDMGTSMLFSEGTGDSSNKVITLEGRADCPATGRKDMLMKQVIRVVGVDRHVMEMYADGQKSMEITYTKQ